MKAIEFLNHLSFIKDKQDYDNEQMRHANRKS